MVIFNPSTGLVEFARVFDTYQTSEEFEKFIGRGVQAGKIVVAAAMDDCMTNLSEKAMVWFESMGSRVVRDVGYRCGFVFIGVSGKTEANESRATQIKDKVSASQIFHVNVEVPEPTPANGPTENLLSKIPISKAPPK